MSIQEQIQHINEVKSSLTDEGMGVVKFATQLSYLLFLKYLHDSGQDIQELNEGLRWNVLAAAHGIEQHEHYKNLLAKLASPRNAVSPAASERVHAFFFNATPEINRPRALTKLVSSISHLDWFEIKTDPGFQAFFESLLEEAESKRKTKAQDYFTSRVAIRSMIRVLNPKSGEIIQDPACGVGGFLVEASKHIHRETDDLFDVPSSDQELQRHRAFYGFEINPDKYPLLVLNGLLYGIENSLRSYDTLSPAGKELPKADVIFCNPPFKSFRKGERATRDDLTYVSGSKQLCFLQHIYRGLKPGGRAAVMLPDNVLFDTQNNGPMIRSDLMDKCNLHTILRLPEGLYPGQGVKINTLFFNRCPTDSNNTHQVWFYDMRTNMPAFGKRNPVTDADFEAFERCFGSLPDGSSERTDLGLEGRFRAFSRQQIRENGDSLDVSWLKDENTIEADNLERPEFYADAILEALNVATQEMIEVKKSLQAE